MADRPEEPNREIDILAVTMVMRHDQLILLERLTTLENRLAVLEKLHSRQIKAAARTPKLAKTRRKKR